MDSFLFYPEIIWLLISFEIWYGTLKSDKCVFPKKLDNVILYKNSVVILVRTKWFSFLGLESGRNLVSDPTRRMYNNVQNHYEIPQILIVSNQRILKYFLSVHPVFSRIKRINRKCFQAKNPVGIFSNTSQNICRTYF